MRSVGHTKFFPSMLNTDRDQILPHRAQHKVQRSLRYASRRVNDRKDQYVSETHGPWLCTLLYAISCYCFLCYNPPPLFIVVGTLPHWFVDSPPTCSISPVCGPPRWCSLVFEQRGGI